MSDTRWHHRIRPSDDDLPPEEREAQAAFWKEAALREHAAIARAALLVQQQLVVGAPGVMVAEAARAVAECTEHARAAFSLASALAEEEVEPAPLPPLAAVQDDIGVVALAVLPGLCVDRALWGALLAEGAEAQADPVLGRQLLAMAEAAERHAAMAWRFVRWCLDAGASEEAVREACRVELATLPALPLPPGLDPERARAALLRCADTAIRPGVAEMAGASTALRFRS